VITSRRSLLAAIGLALPASALTATDAKAISSTKTTTPHKSTHHASASSHKRTHHASTGHKPKSSHVAQSRHGTHKKTATAG
jgi:hypothetical protein